MRYLGLYITWRLAWDSNVHGIGSFLWSLANNCGRTMCTIDKTLRTNPWHSWHWNPFSFSFLVSSLITTPLALFLGILSVASNFLNLLYYFLKALLKFQVSKVICS
ncbi:hypothetical protein V6Z11_D09G121000 [Gossypium hirsutum]